MKQIGYARTTINDNDLASQIATLTAYGCDEIYHESFDSTNQQAVADLETVIQRLAAGDTLIVCQLDRLGKSTRQLTELTKLFQERALHLVSLAEAIDTRSEMGNVYFTLMEGLANMECNLIKERTLVGLNEARKKGKVGGRPKIDGRTVRKIRRLYYDKKETIQFISNKCGVSVGTCYKYINLPEEDVERIYS
ncbi:recombinase family protein [Enterococcus canis]|nr:recombinase family protein [Enterococcus canis]